MKFSIKGFFSRCDKIHRKLTLISDPLDRIFAIQKRSELLPSLKNILCKTACNKVIKNIFLSSFATILMTSHQSITKKFNTYELWSLPSNMKFHTTYIDRLTLSWRRPLPCRIQSIDLLCKSMDWILHDNGLRHERVKVMNWRTILSSTKHLNITIQIC